jgi:hypothetical protein
MILNRFRAWLLRAVMLAVHLFADCTSHQLRAYGSGEQILSAAFAPCTALR